MTVRVGNLGLIEATICLQHRPTVNKKLNVLIINCMANIHITVRILYWIFLELFENWFCLLGNCVEHVSPSISIILKRKVSEHLTSYY